MPWAALDADALERIVAWVLQLRAHAGASIALRSEPFPELLLCLEDVVFVALACKPLREAMVSVLERHRAAVASAYGVALPPPSLTPPPSPTRPEREGLSILADATTWKRPKLVTSIEGIFVSPQRYAYATQGFADVYYYPEDRFPMASRRHSLWDHTHATPCGRGTANLRFLEVACARDARDLARKEAFAGYRLSEAAVSAMLRVAPLTMILGSFPELLSEHPRRCGFHFNERHHQLLVANAAFWGRTDVLDRLVHSNPQACRAYDKQRGLLRTIREELQFPSAGADGPTDLQRWIVDPAVAGDRPGVLQWLVQVREDLERQAYVGHVEMRQFRFTLPTHPDFMESAWLAARRGAVDALDWLFYTACAPIHEAGYGDYPFETTAAALGVLVLAFGGGRRGDTAGRQGGHRVARDGLQAVGASARWAQATWQTHADNFYTDVAHNTTYDLLRRRDPLPKATAERETFLGFLALLNSYALAFEIERRAGSDAAWTLGEWLLSRRALRHFARHALADVGDADRARWLIEESAPGGFLASVVPTPEIDPDQCARVETLLQGLSVPPALAMRTLRTELQRVFAEGRLGSIAQPPAFRESCTGRDALLQTALLMALQNQSGTHVFEGCAHAHVSSSFERTVAVDRVDARGTIRANAADALRHGSLQWGAHGATPTGPFAFPARTWLHCPALLGRASLATKLGVHELRGVNSADAAAGLLMAAYVESVLVGAEPRPAPLSVDTKCALVATGCFFPCPHPERVTAAERAAAAALAGGEGPAVPAHMINRIGLHKNLRGPLRRLLAAVRARPGSRPEDAPLGDALRALCESEDLSAQAW